MLVIIAPCGNCRLAQNAPEPTKPSEIPEPTRPPPTLVNFCVSFHGKNAIGEIDMKPFCGIRVSKAFTLFGRPLVSFSLDIMFTRNIEVIRTIVKIMPDNFE